MTKTKGNLMKTMKRYMGPDVHKDRITIGMAEGRRGSELRVYGQISSALRALEKLRHPVMAGARPASYHARLPP